MSHPVTFPRYEKMSHFARIWPARSKCRNVTLFSYKNTFFSYDPFDIVTSPTPSPIALSLRPPAMGDTLPPHSSPLIPAGGS